MKLIRFWAPWCRRSQATEPVFHQLAELLGNRVEFVKVNIDDDPNEAARYGIRSTPALLLVSPAGVPLENLTGVAGNLTRLEMALRAQL